MSYALKGEVGRLAELIDKLESKVQFSSLVPRLSRLNDANASFESGEPENEANSSASLTGLHPR